MKRFTMAVLCVACGSSSVKSQLTSVATASTTACPTGGTTITLATDKNGNGVIDAGEVTSSQNICNGPPPVAQTLTSSTPVLAGTSGCQLGGVQINTGVDNGANGGTANNGVLDAGEITGTQIVCAWPGIVNQGPLAGPGSPTPNKTVSAKGGQSTSAAGGGAGSLSVTGAGSLGGSTAIFKSGQADASFAAPAITPNMGTTSSAVATINDVELVSTAIPVKGYFLENTGNDFRLIYTTDSNTTHTIVTGLHITPAGTLNFTAGGHINLDNDIWNEGGLIESENGPLTIGCANYVGTSNSRITMSGAAGSPLLVISAAAMLINATGPTTTNGAPGFAAGAISLIAGSKLYNAGPISAVGGTTAAGAAISLSGNLGVYNSGTIDASGGSTVSAGTITLSAKDGDVVNGGNLTANGGSGATAGQGGAVLLETLGGDIINAAAISTVGGQSTGAAGGAAGNITFTSIGNAEQNGAQHSKGSITVSGDLTADGGTSTTGAGGSGAAITLSNTVIGNFDGQQVLLLGYNNVTLTGGQGTTTSGSGGIFNLQATRTSGDLSTSSNTGFSGPAGAAVNEAAIDVSAGTSTGTTGAAGTVNIFAGHEFPYVTDNANALVINRGTIMGTSATAESTSVNIIGHDGAENDGAIVANTGDNSSARIFIECFSGTASNSAKIDISSTADGANAGSIAISGPQVKNTADLTANGAPSTTAKDGGNGGSISLLSTASATVNPPTVVLSVSGGTAANTTYYPGLAGIITIDGKTK